MKEDGGGSARLLHAASIDTTLVVLLWAQLRGARLAGYEVHTASAAGANREWLERHGVVHEEVDFRRSITPLADLKSLWQLYCLLRRKRITILHTHTPKVALLGPLAAKLAGVPVVVNTVHGFYFHDEMSRMARWFHIAMAWIGGRFTSLTLSQNQEDVETAVRLGICPRDRVRVLGNGVNLSRFDPGRFDDAFRRRKREEYGVPKGRLVLGVIGRLVVDKGYEDLFEAMRALAVIRDDFHLLIVGPRETARAGSIDLDASLDDGLRGRATYIGTLERVEEFLACVDVFVLASRREGFPRAAIEAAAMGLPIVATDIRGCRQVVAHGENGLLVPSRSPLALKDAVSRLLDDGAMRERMGRLGRERALREFDETRVCERVLGAYAELLEKHGLGQPTRRADLDSELPTSAPFVW